MHVGIHVCMYVCMYFWQTFSLIICFAHTKMYARCLRKCYVEIRKVRFARRVVNEQQHRYAAATYAHTPTTYCTFIYAPASTKK